MAKCRICGAEFTPNNNSGHEICGNDGCWEKAWNNTVARLRGEKPEETAVRVNHRITKEERQLVIELHSQGKRRKEIAEITHISYANVGRIIQKYEYELTGIYDGAPTE